MVSLSNHQGDNSGLLQEPPVYTNKFISKATCMSFPFAPLEMSFLTGQAGNLSLKQPPKSPFLKGTHPCTPPRRGIDSCTPPKRGIEGLRTDPRQGEDKSRDDTKLIYKCRFTYYLISNRGFCKSIKWAPSPTPPVEGGGYLSTLSPGGRGQG
jgi:hypothetical protein